MPHYALKMKILLINKVRLGKLFLGTFLQTEYVLPSASRGGHPYENEIVNNIIHAYCFIELL